jgi:hypothetical protein
MDLELRLILKLTRNLPKIKGSGVLANIIKDFYNRKKRTPIFSYILDFQMKLDPAECVDGGILFYPQLYDYQEISFIRNRLTKGDIFLDIGANIGFYTLAASKIVGGDGRIISVEADPYNYEKLCENIALNKCQNIISCNVGVSDKKEQLRLGLSLNGNRGGIVFCLLRKMRILFF